MARNYINRNHIRAYKKAIDSLNKSVGRSIDIYVGSGIPTANWDPVNNEPIDPNEAVTYDWTIHTIENVSIRWFNKEEFSFTPGGRIETGDCRVKCKLEDVLVSGTNPNNDTLFHNADKVIVDGETCKVMKPPRKTGLDSLHSVEVILERVDPF